MSIKPDELLTGSVTQTVVPLAERTADGQTAVLEGYGPVSTLRAQVAVTAATGTDPDVGSPPHVKVIVEDTLDGTHWNELTYFYFRDIGHQCRYIDFPFSDRLRVRWEITPGTSWTFNVIWQCDR